MMNWSPSCWNAVFEFPVFLFRRSHPALQGEGRGGGGGFKGGEGGWVIWDHRALAVCKYSLYVGKGLPRRQGARRVTGAPGKSKIQRKSVPSGVQACWR